MYDDIESAKGAMYGCVFILFAIAIAVSAWRGYRRTHAASFIILGSFMILSPWVRFIPIPYEWHLLDVVVHVLPYVLTTIAFAWLAHAFKKPA